MIDIDELSCPDGIKIRKSDIETVYKCELTDEAILKIDSWYKRYPIRAVTDAVEIAMEQYDSPVDVIKKTEGILYNREKENKRYIK